LISIEIKPAPPGSGIVFCRTDLGGASVAANIGNVDFDALKLATTLRKGEASVQTTEHLMAALFAMGVDNAHVLIDGPETPIMDGSSAPFLVLLDEAGLERQAVPRRRLRVTKPVSFRDGDKRVWVEPARDLRISYEISYDHPLIRSQSKSVNISAAAFEKQIASARTFGFLKEVNYLKSIGLIQGGSVDNAIVLDGDRILNESLRLEDEFVSHKILDFIGDLALSGYRLAGHFHGYKAGHEMHARFLRELMRRTDAYVIETVRDQESRNTAPEFVLEVA
jgi:UDP-3-O-[3-hydroxymyristoyl] N-acetylglucosamine deacetylase